MKLRLTDLAIKKLNLPASGQVTYWDELTPGFGVRCSTKSKSYVVMFGARRKLKTMGRYPELSLAEARRQARLFFATELGSQSSSNDYDYQVVVDAYLKDCQGRLRGSTLKGFVLYLTNIRFEGTIGAISQADILKAIEGYTNSPSSQNYAFTTFKVFFNWAVRRQYVAANPLNALKRPNRYVSRDRVLSDNELKTLLTYTLKNRGRFNDIVSLLAFTGQRKGEISDLRWSEVDSDTLVFAPERTPDHHRDDQP